MSDLSSLPPIQPMGYQYWLERVQASSGEPHVQRLLEGLREIDHKICELDDKGQLQVPGGGNMMTFKARILCGDRIRIVGKLIEELRK